MASVNRLLSCMVTISDYISQLSTNTKILTNLVLKQLTKQFYKNTVVTPSFPFPCALINVSLCDNRGNTIHPLVIDSP